MANSVSVGSFVIKRNGPIPKLRLRFDSLYYVKLVCSEKVLHVVVV